VNARRLGRWLLKIAGFGLRDTTVPPPVPPDVFLVLADGQVLPLTPTIQQDRDAVWLSMQRLTLSSTATAPISSERLSTSPDRPVTNASS